MKLISNGIELKILTLTNYNSNYSRWLSDPEINQFLETKEQTDEQIQDYIIAMEKSPNDFLFGIFDQQSNFHIGNIKLGFISYKHGFGEIGLLIGEKSYQGKGIGSTSIQLICDYAQKEVGLRKTTAGLYANNISSHKAFLKVGFREVGRWTNHRFFHDRFIDEILLEKLF